MTISQQIVNKYIKYEKIACFEPISCLYDLDLDLKKII